MNIGNSLKVALIKKGISQTQLAKQMGVHTQWINKLANSETASQGTIVSLAVALDMKTSEFISLGEE